LNFTNVLFIQIVEVNLSKTQNEIIHMNWVGKKASKINMII